jgi:hypothetical protein
MNDGPKKFHTGYLVEGLELSIRKVAYTKYDATWLVPWSDYSQVLPSFYGTKPDFFKGLTFRHPVLIAIGLLRDPAPTFLLLHPYHWFDSRLVNLGFVVDKVALG